MLIFKPQNKTTDRERSQIVISGFASYIVDLKVKIRSKYDLYIGLKHFQT